MFPAGRRSSLPAGPRRSQRSGRQRASRHLRPALCRWPGSLRPGPPRSRFERTGPDLLRRRLERRRILRPRSEGQDFVSQPTCHDEGVVSSGCDDEAGRHGQPRPAQLAQVGALPARERDVILAYLVTPDPVRHVRAPSRDPVTLLRRSTSPPLDRVLGLIIAARKRRRNLLSPRPGARERRPTRLAVVAAPGSWLVVTLLQVHLEGLRVSSRQELLDNREVLFPVAHPGRVSGAMERMYLGLRVCLP